MTYIGRVQAGCWLDVYFQVTNASRTPLMPDRVPILKIRDNAGTVILTQPMPIVDKTVNIGLFCSRIFLGAAFSVGVCSVQVVYFLSGAMMMKVFGFEVAAGGDPNGQVLSMYYLHLPQSERIVYSVESGSLLTGKNPRVN